MSDALKGVDFGIIRYANCWEDAGLLLGALAPVQPRRIGIVASAGDNALALLSLGEAVEAVTAFDISLPQLYLTELKQVAYDRLEYDELLAFLGCSPCPEAERERVLAHLAGHLTPGARSYWQGPGAAAIKPGLIHAGKFERYFRTFRRWCLPLVHTQREVAGLLAPKAVPEAQAQYYRTHWNTRRWQTLMAVFFSRAVMGRAGRDPRFLDQVAGSVQGYIRSRAEAHLASRACTENHFLRYMLTGSFGPQLPHYLRPEHYKAIRAGLAKLTLRHGMAQVVMAEGGHEAYCLSNIFEYLPQADFDDLGTEWARMLPAGTRLLYWNLMVPRSLAALMPQAFARQETGGLAVDNGFFYSAFIHEQRL